MPLNQLTQVCVGVVLTIAVCTILRISTSTRSALAALVIVLLQEMGKPMWSYALQRIAAVLLGCLVGYSPSPSNTLSGCLERNVDAYLVIPSNTGLLGSRLPAEYPQMVAYSLTSSPISASWLR